MGHNIRFDSVWDCIRHKANVAAECSCGNRAVFVAWDLYWWAHGHRASDLFDQLRHRVRCEACGGEAHRLRPTVDPATRSLDSAPKRKIADLA